MEVDIWQLPIPDWGLTCSECGYPLDGLPAHRCPECGVAVDMRERVRPWTRVRPPRFTGRDLPIPEWGLACSGCGRPLAGAPSWQCPGCGRVADVGSLRPPGEWFVLDAELCRGIPMSSVQALLAGEHVPHLPIGEKSLGEIYGGTTLAVTALRVASEFYFDVLALLQQTRRDIAIARMNTPDSDWRCPDCGEDSPAHFEVCWNCGAERI